MTPVADNEGLGRLPSSLELAGLTVSTWRGLFGRSLWTRASFLGLSLLLTLTLTLTLVSTGYAPTHLQLGLNDMVRILVPLISDIDSEACRLLLLSICKLILKNS